MTRARAEQHRGGHHEDREVGPVLLDRRLAVEGRPPRQRPHGPDREHEEHAAEQPAARGARRRPEPRREERRGDGRDHRQRQPDRRGEHEAGVRHLDEHARRAERVQPEEPRGDQERHRDEEQPRVFVPARLERGLDGQHAGDHRGDQHEPEVRRLVLPHEGVVDGGIVDEQPEPEQRQRDVDQPHERTRREPTEPTWETTQAQPRGSPRPQHRFRSEPTGRVAASGRPSVLEERDVDPAEDPVDRRVVGDELQAAGHEAREACCGRRRRRSRGRVRRAAPLRAWPSSTSLPGRSRCCGSSERISSSRLGVQSSHAAPSIADSAMRCSVPSMPSPCGNGSAGASQGST